MLLSSAEIACDRHQSRNGAVDGEPDEFAPLHDLDHEFAGQTSRDERCEESGDERPCGDTGGQIAACRLEQGFAQDRSRRGYPAPP